MENNKNKQIRCNFSFYRAARGAEIGPQLETDQRVCKNKTEAIKMGRLIANQAGWRLVQINNCIDNSILYS